MFLLCFGLRWGRNVVFDFAYHFRHRNDMQIPLLERNVDLALVEFTEHRATNVGPQSRGAFSGSGTQKYDVSSIPSAPKFVRMV